MRICVDVQDFNKKLKYLEEAEEHIKAAKRLLMWEIGETIYLELKEPPKEDGDSNS